MSPVKKIAHYSLFFYNIYNNTERTILLRDLKFCWLQIWK